MPVKISLDKTEVNRFLYAQMTRFLHTIGALFAYKRHTLVEQHSLTHARRPADHGHIIVAGAFCFNEDRRRGPHYHELEYRLARW